jgi:hypothetical protein
MPLTTDDGLCELYQRLRPHSQSTAEAVDAACPSLLRAARRRPHCSEGRHARAFKHAQQLRAKLRPWYVLLRALSLLRASANALLQGQLCLYRRRRHHRRHRRRH